MRKVGDLSVFALAARIPGLHGVELQIASGNHSLWDRETLRRYKREANRYGIQLPSLSSPFGRGNSILTTAPARQDLIQAIRAAEFLGSSVILVPFFRDNCPPLSNEAAWAPVVEMLRGVAPNAADAGVTLGLENSLSPSDNVTLCDRVSHPAVRIYYDIDNCEFYGHKDQSVPGVNIMGRERISQVHVKNEERLIEQPGRVPWRAAFAALRQIGYDGWFVFETRHSSDDQCVEATIRNIAFLRSCLS